MPDAKAPLAGSDPPSRGVVGGRWIGGRRPGGGRSGDDATEGGHAGPPDRRCREGRCRFALRLAVGQRDLKPARPPAGGGVLDRRPPHRWQRRRPELRGRDEPRIPVCPAGVPRHRRRGRAGRPADQPRHLLDVVAPPALLAGSRRRLRLSALAARRVRHGGAAEVVCGRGPAELSRRVRHLPRGLAGPVLAPLHGRQRSRLSRWSERVRGPAARGGAEPREPHVPQQRDLRRDRA